MVMNEIFVWMLCECNLYVIPKSIRRKDLGYKLFISNMFGHGPGGRPEWTSTQDPASKSVGSRCPRLR